MRNLRIVRLYSFPQIPQDKKGLSVAASRSMTSSIKSFLMNTCRRARGTAISIPGLLCALFPVLFSSIPVQGRVREYDVVVYGGTASGVIAAVAAAREGAAVALLAPESHLGGMVSNGLGA